jgi:hypothetical protein
MATSLMNLSFSQGSSADLNRSPSIGLDTRPPMCGQWVAGDIIYNTTPAIGAPSGWICTASGCPGLWIALPEVLS